MMIRRGQGMLRLLFFPWCEDDTYQINKLELPSEDASPNDDRFGS